MKKHLTKGFLFVLSLMLLCTCTALADSVSFDGTVTAERSVPVYAPIGGTVAELNVEAGDTVAVGDVLAQLKTQKVYAETNGTVRGIFAQPGDSAQTVAERFGAVMYIEGDVKYTVSGSTTNAYSSIDTVFIHTGETVYMRSRSDDKRTAVGTVTKVDGVNYTVEVQSGDLLIGETVEIFRKSSFVYTSRLGRGTVARVSPTAVSGSGSIVSFAVSEGDTVKRGDLLFETLDGSFDGLYMSGTQIVCDEAGVIGTLNLSVGQSVQKDSVAAVIYPLDAMCIQGELSEEDLGSVSVGDPVTVELLWNEGEDVIYAGEVTAISSMASQSQGESGVTFTVTVSFTPDEHTRYGMSANVTVTKPADADEERYDEEEDIEEPTDEEADEEANEAPEAFDGFVPEGFENLPEGFAPEGFENFPEGFEGMPEGFAPEGL